MSNFYTGLIGRKLRPLTEKESEIFIGLVLLGRDPDRMQACWANFKTKIPAANILVSRLPEHEKFKPQLLTFISTIVKTPGDLVLWAYTLNYMRAVMKMETVGFDEWIGPFGYGIPTEEGMSEAWREQKIDGRNRLDVEKFWPFEIPK